MLVFNRRLKAGNASVVVYGIRAEKRLATVVYAHAYKGQKDAVATTVTGDSRYSQAGTARRMLRPPWRRCSKSRDDGPQAIP